ncbi:carboxypeptidase-like regulatory domain-containing protein [Botrimarina mediterranea]|uniref:Carboxypeptidase regulatory-like domain-containing protein n=1 Tax=Botrimarina mediterranea TaxID=2528022 RepID=A0A518KCQ7_9BACT|nr:carboxypeptidase-like regulatory domain-containing protein [Botrimarina mediterranea]QDV75580.1 hypothetical protein Spa11_37990 [Botrimarina mediterranea]QDV80214.1 hypothetical protein K2D_38390 [Planctomycetes bacterium K2D]
MRYHVGAKGFARQDVRLVPKSEPHVVTLNGPLVVEGVATDRATGEPIAEFQAMPVIVFGPNFYSTRYEDTGQGADGQYELPLKGSGDPESRYRVRFEAEGYRTVVSESSYGPQDGRVTLNIALEPARPRRRCGRQVRRRRDRR